LEKKEKRGLRFHQCIRQHEKTAKEREKGGQERCNRIAHLRKQKTLSDPEEDEETQKLQSKKHIPHTSTASTTSNAPNKTTTSIISRSRTNQSPFQK
jgi:hypothetical protein